jgi:hypothetical protein
VDARVTHQRPDQRRGSLELSGAALAAITATACATIATTTAACATTTAVTTPASASAARAPETAPTAALLLAGLVHHQGSPFK